MANSVIILKRCSSALAACGQLSWLASQSQPLTDYTLSFLQPILTTSCSRRLSAQIHLFFQAHAIMLHGKPKLKGCVYYAASLLVCFNLLLCSILCQHNPPRPNMYVHIHVLQYRGTLHNINEGNMYIWTSINIWTSSLHYWYTCWYLHHPCCISCLCILFVAFMISWLLY